MLSEQNKISVNIEDEMRKSYMDYAMSVIVGRALPDVRDGLKPVHRRVLFAMSELSNEWNKAYKKSARVVGDVIGKYHPHGDTAVYDTIVRMAQDFSMRYPLVDGQGNFGSIDGDPPAAMRYTEARLTHISGEILADIEKETVDFSPNFDETDQEPVVMPTRVPNLLVNGATGIAVGMATNIPPHNLTEVIDAAILLIDKPNASLGEVMKLVPGPDFPTGGYLWGREGIQQAYTTGRGTFTMRAKVAIEQVSKDRQNIVVTEIPYQVNKARMIERIADLVQNKRVEGIADIRDESDREGMRVVIEVKRGEEPDIILNNLYKYTQMQESFGMILLAIVGGQPRDRGVLTVYAKEDAATRQCKNLVRYVEPPRDRGKMVLLDGTRMWFYDPASKVSIRISAQQRLMGQASNGDVMTVNLARDYRAALAGEETLKDADRNERACWRLELAAATDDGVDASMVTGIGVVGDV